MSCPKKKQKQKCVPASPSYPEEPIKCPKYIYCVLIDKEENREALEASAGVHSTSLNTKKGNNSKNPPTEEGTEMKSQGNYMHPPRALSAASGDGTEKFPTSLPKKCNNPYRAKKTLRKPVTSDTGTTKGSGTSIFLHDSPYA